MADSALGYNGPPQVQAKDLNAGPMGGDQGVIPGSISSETIRFKIEAVTAEEWTRLQETGVDQDDSSIMRQMTNAATSAVAGMAALAAPAGLMQFNGSLVAAELGVPAAWLGLLAADDYRRHHMG